MNTTLITIYLLNLFPFIVILTYVLYFTCRKTHNVPLNKNPNEPVSIIICTYNDAHFLNHRIAHFLDTENWIEGSEIVICNDGSTDETEEILAKYAGDKRVVVVSNKKNIGKINSLNRLVPIAKNELLVFSDVRQKIKSGSIKSMATHFQDKEIGIVTCKVEDNLNGRKLSLQRRISNKIAAVNSQNGYCLSLFGALYMQRKVYFKPIPEEILFDDFYALCTGLGSTYKIVQDTHASFYDIHFHQYYYQERIERLTRGMLLQLTIPSNPIHKIPKKIRIQLIINKYLKFLLPFNTVIILTMIILFHLWNRFFLTLGVLAVLCSILFILPKTKKHMLSICKISYYFIITTMKYVFKGNRSNKWQKLVIHD